MTPQEEEEEGRRMGEERKKLMRDKRLPRDRNVSSNNLRSAMGLNSQLIKVAHHSLPA